jgi:hypothetical protein
MINKENGKGAAYNTHSEAENCKQNFSFKISLEEIS